MGQRFGVLVPACPSFIGVLWGLKPNHASRIIKPQGKPTDNMHDCTLGEACMQAIWGDFIDLDEVGRVDFCFRRDKRRVGGMQRDRHLA
jgi:hypothetical protein